MSLYLKNPKGKSNTDEVYEKEVWEEDYFDKKNNHKKKSKNSFRDLVWIKTLSFRLNLKETWRIWRLVFIFPIAISTFKILVCGVLGLCAFDLSDNIEKIWIDFFFTGTLFGINAFRIHLFSFIVLYIYSYFNEW
jgi:hypothetical protein